MCYINKLAYTEKLDNDIKLQRDTPRLKHHETNLGWLCKLITRKEHEDLIMSSG